MHGEDKEVLQINVVILLVYSETLIKDTPKEAGKTSMQRISPLAIINEDNL